MVGPTGSKQSVPAKTFPCASFSATLRRSRRHARSGEAAEDAARLNASVRQGREDYVSRSIQIRALTEHETAELTDTAKFNALRPVRYKSCGNTCGFGRRVFWISGSLRLSQPWCCDSYVELTFLNPFLRRVTLLAGCIHRPIFSSTRRLGVVYRSRDRAMMLFPLPCRFHCGGNVVPVKGSRSSPCCKSFTQIS